MRRASLSILAFALLAAACGSSDDGRVATLDETTTMTVADDRTAVETDEARLMVFASCMRDNGVPDFPDPDVSGDGSVDFGGLDRFNDFDQDALEDAFGNCTEHLEGLSFAPGGENFDLTEIQDTLVEFAGCMRENGYDLPDPDFALFSLESGTGPFGEIDPTAPGFEDAFDACRDVFADLPFGG